MVERKGTSDAAVFRTGKHSLVFPELPEHSNLVVLYAWLVKWIYIQKPTTEITREHKEIKQLSKCVFIKFFY